MSWHEKDGLEFEIEDHDFYDLENILKTSRLTHVKTPEFVGRFQFGKKKEMCHVFIEAKTSAPVFKKCELKKGIAPVLPDNWKILSDFEMYLKDISQKFADGFNMCQAILDQRHKENDLHSLPDHWKKIYSKKTRFVLLIDFQDEERPEDTLRLCALLKEEMKHFLNSWNIPESSVRVVSYENAKDLNIAVRHK